MCAIAECSARHAAWREYYTPMQERLRILATKYAGDADAQAVLKDSADEIAVYRDHGTLAMCFW
jgi:hypothetical protein